MSRCDQSVADGDAHAVHEVVAVGLDEHLDAGSRRPHRELRQPGLSAGMEMRLRVLDQAERPRGDSSANTTGSTYDSPNPTFVARWRRVATSPGRSKTKPATTASAATTDSS